jgi:tRNA threonylcarbamoyladenosine modification (KEOPS) complex Cgi121 subunit
MKSTNVSGQANFSGKLKVYRHESGYFETIAWEDEAKEAIIELQDKDAQTQIEKRFVKFTSAKAIEYFTRDR